MPGYSQDFASKKQEAMRENLDNKKVKILADRWAKMKADKAEAEAYFASNAYVPRATNEHLIIQEYGH